MAECRRMSGSSKVGGYIDFIRNDGRFEALIYNAIKVVK